MSEPFLGEIRMFGGNFAPVGHAMCNGQLLPIDQNQALFALIGTTYGGDGLTTFALPDLQSRVPVHMGQGNGLSNRVIGELAGVETVTLTANQIPTHTHVPGCVSATNATQASPAGGVWAKATSNLYSTTNPASPMLTAGPPIQNTGGNQPHDNMIPFLGITFIIALQGIFPSRN